MRIARGLATWSEKVRSSGWRRGKQTKTNIYIDHDAHTHSAWSALTIAHRPSRNSVKAHRRRSASSRVELKIKTKKERPATQKEMFYDIHDAAASILYTTCEMLAHGEGKLWSACGVVFCCCWLLVVRNIAMRARWSKPLRACNLGAFRRKINTKPRIRRA